MLLAFSPKVTALIMSILNPVMAAYMTILLALVFVGGIRIAVQDRVDKRIATIVGVAFWIGFGFQHESICSDRLGGYGAHRISVGSDGGQ